MYKAAVLLTAAFLALVFAACPMDSGNNGNKNPEEPNNPQNPDNPDNPNPNTTGYFLLKTTGVKSLYVGDTAVQYGQGSSSSIRAVGTNPTIQTLSYINAAGQNAPVYFVSPSGKIVVLEVTDLQGVGENCTLVSFNSYYEITETDSGGQKTYTLGQHKIMDEYYMYGKSSKALINWEKDKIYDFKDQGRLLFAEGDLLFTLNDDYRSSPRNLLSKIDLAAASNGTLQAVALNNPDFLPVNSVPLPYTIDNKVLINEGTYSLDLAGAANPVTVTMPALAADTFREISGTVPLPMDFLANWPYALPFRDLAGKPWLFAFYKSEEVGKWVESTHIYVDAVRVGFKESANTEGNKNSNFSSQNYLITGLTLDGSGKFNIPTDSVQKSSLTFEPSHEVPRMFFFDVSNTGRMKRDSSTDDYIPHTAASILLAYSNGLIRLNKKASGIDVQSTALTIPVSSLSREKAFINKDNYLYYLEGSSIKRLYLSAGSSPETVYTNSRIISSGSSNRDFLTATGSRLIFYQYAENSATTVNTYSLDMYTPGAQPTLLASNDMEVRNIVELDF